MLIQSTNNLQVNSVKTYLTNLEVSGTNVLRWKNPAGFAASWAVQIGETGEEQTEVVLLGTATPSGTAGTLTANTLYEHPADTPLYAIKYNQVVFERSTAGTAGTATPMTGGTITYQADHQFTQFDDTSGSITYAYRTYFRSSVLAVTTTESDWLTSSGFSFYSLARLRDRTKKKLWDAGYIKEDSTIDDWHNEWKDEMSNTVIALNEDYALGTVDVAFGTAGLGTITTADYKNPRRFWVTTNGLDYYQSTKMSINDFVPNQVFSATHPYHAWQGDTVFQVKPDATAGTARLVFYRFGTTMVNDTDELPQPFRSYTKSFVDYAVGQALFKDGKLDAYDRKMGEARVSKQEFVTQMTPRDLSGPTWIDVVEPISADDDFGGGI